MFFVDDENLVLRRNKLVEQLEDVEHELFIDDVSDCCYLENSEKEDLLKKKQQILQQIANIDERIKDKEDEAKKIDELIDGV